MQITPTFLNRIKTHEGFRSKPYLCSKGKLTIGFGRNLESKGLSQKEAETLLLNDVDEAVNALEKEFDFFKSLNQTRQEVLTEMCFNLGLAGLKKFQKMIQALDEKNYVLASQEMMKSAWATQVKKRAQTLSQLMKTGTSE